MSARYHVDAEEARRLRRCGLSVRQVADRLGCSERHITRLTGTAGPSTPMTAEQIAIVERLLDEGASVREAALTVGVSTRTVHAHWPGRAWSRDEVSEFANAVRRFNREMDAAGLARRGRSKA